MAKVSAGRPKYGTYKYSGQEWLGSIPSHWEVKALKHGATIVLGKMLCPENKGGYFLRPYLKSKNIQWLNAETSSVDEMWFSKGEMELYRLKKADLVLSEGGEVGKTCYWNEELPECYIQNSAHRVRFFKGHNPRYFLYQFFSAGNIGHFDSIVSKVSIAHLTREKLANANFAFPTEQEQADIAHFLDQQSVQIDAAIQIKERQIERLKERKQILIQQAVTRGLDPLAPMRDSGIEWIGEIPAHWDVMANRALFRERVEPGREDLPLLSVSIHSGVSEEEISEEENIRGRVKIEDKSKYIRVRPGDITFNMMRAWQGAIGAVRVEGMVSPAYTIAVPRPGLDARYFEYQYRTPGFIQQMDRYSKGITDFRKRLYWDGFKQLTTLVPPLEEQLAIIEFIEQAMMKQNAAVALLEQQITKLKEYKATLINSAVTGKIKVPGVVEPSENKEREIA